MDAIISFLTDFNIRNVVLGAALLGVSSGVLGSFAVLRRQSLLGDTLAHASLPGVCLAFLIVGTRQALPTVLGALVVGTIAAFTVLLIIRRSRLKTDAAQGIVLSVFFALGIVMLTFIGNQNNAGQAGLESFLLGQAASILPADVRLMFNITLIACALVLVMWKAFKVISFDSDFAASLGIPVLNLELLMTAMVALAIVIGLQLVGVVLMASMLIAPAVAARQWVKSLEMMVLLAAVFGMLSGVSGALLSSLGRGYSTGPLIVICASVIVMISLFLAPERGLLWAAIKRRRHHGVLRTRQVLTDMYHIAEEHNDKQYPIEIGMVNSLYGMRSERVLERLRSQGWLRYDQHMPEEGRHVVLTSGGYKEAERILKDLTKHD